MYLKQDRQEITLGNLETSKVEHQGIDQSSIQNEEDSKFISKNEEFDKELQNFEENNNKEFEYKPEELNEDTTRWIIPAKKTLLLVVKFFTK